MRDSIYRFLTADAVHSDMIELRFFLLANSLLFIMNIVSFLAMYLNFFVFHYPLLAILDMIIFVTSLLAIIDLKKNRVLKRSIFVATGTLFLFLLAFSYENQSTDFGLIWNIFFPIFTISLLEKKQGLIFTAIFYLLLFSMAYHNIGIWDDGQWNFRSFIRFSGTLLILAYIAYMYKMILNRIDLELELTRKQEAQYLQELYNLSITDPLTGLHNRRRMNEALQEYIHNTQRYQDSFSLILFDIDDFKHVNDNYGHNVGDEVLIMIAKITKNSLRKTDFISRWGGEEFLILLPKTHLEEAANIAEKLRIEIENSIYFENKRVTCSFGVAQYKDGLENSAIVNQADEALYVAKKSGKNRIVKADKKIS